MYSIASILNKENVEIWRQLENRCQISGLKQSGIPHFSWQTAESYEFQPLRGEMESICDQIQPFYIHTSGLGVFAGERRVLFLIIAKDRNLMEMHQRIWERAIRYAKTPSQHYSPDNWVPHISLNLNELEINSFECALRDLTASPLEFEFKIEKMGLLYLTLEASGVDTYFSLNDVKRKK